MERLVMGLNLARKRIIPNNFFYKLKQLLVEKV